MWLENLGQRELPAGVEAAGPDPEPGKEVFQAHPTRHPALPSFFTHPHHLRRLLAEKGAMAAALADLSPEA